MMSGVPERGQAEFGPVAARAAEWPYRVGAW